MYSHSPSVMTSGYSDSDFITTPVAPLEPNEEDRTTWTMGFTVHKTFDCPPPKDFRLKLETGVKNGDCLLGCFAALIEALHHGCILSSDLAPPARSLRKQLVFWIKKRWTEKPVFNPEMAVHEIMWMQHDMGITEKERNERGEWGDDPASRLAAYSAQCEKMYFSDSEMMLFSCMMFEKRGIPFLFRTYRCTGDGNAKHITNTPNVEVFASLGIKDCIVVDLDHSGSVDGSSAHYKLLEGGSLDGLIKVHRRCVKRRTM